jgi:hypothetical protein
MAILDSKDLRKVLIALLGTAAAVVGIIFAVQSIGGDSNHCQDHSVCGRGNNVGTSGPANDPSATRSGATAGHP